jgi:hypothetical protein
MEYYSVRTDGNAFRVTKFNEHFEMQTSYKISADGKVCQCPQAYNRNRACRHQEILRSALKYRHVDDGCFLCWQSKSWTVIEETL